MHIDFGYECIVFICIVKHKLTCLLIYLLIINKFIYNSTELESHIQYIQAYKIQGNKMRRNVIHTNSISFISNNILTYIKCRFNINYCQ